MDDLSSIFSDIAIHLSSELGLSVYSTLYGVGVRVPLDVPFDNFQDELVLVRTYLDIHGVSYTESFSERERSYRFNFI